MRFRFLDVFALPFCMAPDDGAGAGGSGGADEDQDAEPKYTEKDLQQRIAQSQERWRKGLQRDLKEKDKQVAELTSRLEQTQKQITELQAQKSEAGEGAGKDRDKELEGRIELLEKKHARQLEELQKQVQAAEQARVAAEQKARLTTRDTLLKQALAEAKCVDVNGGFRILLPEVVYDEDEEDWRIQTPQGNLVTFSEGVKEMLPDYLKPASTQVGGSGSKTGSPARRQKMTELESAKKRLEELKQDAKARPNNVTAIDSWNRQKRIVAKLESELASLTK